VLLEPGGTKAYLGTSKGCVEVWDLSIREKLVELRYLIFDEFGEKVPVEEPVVNLSAPDDFDVVYAFMGQAAYCIDVELNIIHHQIPITETVVWGSVSPILGQVAILSVSGYLSRWSPRFIERIGSIEFTFEIEKGYITHDFDESRIILVLDGEFILLTNLEGERYTVELSYPPAQKLLEAAKFDKNEHYQVSINLQGAADVSLADIDSEYSSTILSKGLFHAAQDLRQAIANMKTDENERTYIQDQRLDRQSKDRYLAEVETLGKHFHQESSITNDSKTLDFAIRESHSEDVQSQSQALSVIDKISRRHGINTNYAIYAWKSDGAFQLIENARFYEFEAVKRKDNIQRIMGISLLLSLILLLSSYMLEFQGLSRVFFLALLILQSIILLYWKGINKHPIIPYIEEFRAVRLANWGVIIGSIVLFAMNSMTSVVESLTDFLPE
jgi:hypothetical protein